MMTNLLKIVSIDLNISWKIEFQDSAASTITGFIHFNNLLIYFLVVLGTLVFFLLYNKTKIKQKVLGFLGLIKPNSSVIIPWVPLFVAIPLTYVLIGQNSPYSFFTILWGVSVSWSLVLLYLLVLSPSSLSYSCDNNYFFSSCCFIWT